MLFSAKAEYACVAMLELAARFGDPKPVRLVEIAEKHGIPQPFLVQILLHLKGAGLIVSTRGASGGYALAKPPGEITLYDVVTVIDRQDQGPRQKDPLQQTMSVQNLRSVWDLIQQTQTEILRQTTLAHLDSQSQALQYVI
jgi:Rrf2 family cysteine metabolism transcriptional repressor